MNWFDVDKKGLAQLLERKGKEFVLLELLQNAWDENCTKVTVSLTRIPNSVYARLTVEDDNPDGFADLTHAFTLFAASAKKADAQKRGRFNLGEKLVLALCEEASIVSTRGTVDFDDGGRKIHRTQGSRRESGSAFNGILRMTTEEMQRCLEVARTLLVPPSIETTINGEQLQARSPVTSISASLPTEIANAEGYMVRTRRTSSIEVFETLPGEVAQLYELGIPVVETGDRWHLNICQKIPLNFNRDNVPPSYLAQVRALTVDHMAQKLSTDDANSAWVREAVQKHGAAMANDTIDRLTTLRFGADRVAFDPSDPEANLRAAAHGYTVVHGSQLSRSEWDAVKRAGAILPAGRVTPSAKPYGEGGAQLKVIPNGDWTLEMRKVVEYIGRVAPALTGRQNIPVNIVREIGWPFAATYGPQSPLVLNLGRLGHKWFAGPLEPINNLLLHELGHHFSGNHLSEEYHDALTSLGARLANLALSQPEIFAPMLSCADADQGDEPPVHSPVHT
ncbi:MAG: hypothetical protein EPN79_11725 [Burkholderiaceae bacterium]|nr:MAG: hypothetical protein EPN79_11725 [Burkholderiaceae bacterium]TBR76674.1 MAG: hypothetical protein EPN64_05340 [Burkholderiaceae bacterium]